MNRKNETLILVFTNFITAMGITNVVPLIGNVSQIFGVSQAYGMWIMTSFMLTYAIGMPLMGKISDSLGRRSIYIMSMSLFTLGLLVSSISSNFNVIIIGRLIQGLGASGTLPISNTIAFELFGEKKGRVIGLISAAFGVGTIAAITLAGFIYSLFGWRMIFFATFAISLIGLFMSFRLPESLKERKPLKIDILGVLTFASMMISFMMIFKELSGNSLLSSEVLPYFLALLVSIMAFLISEFKSKKPFIDLKLFKSLNFSMIIFIALLAGTGMFIAMTMFPSFAQISLGYSISNAAYSISAMAVILIIFSILSGIWVDKRGEESFLILGTISLAVAFYLLSRFSSGSLTYYIFTMIAGIGMGSFITPMNYIAINESGEGNAGIASGMVSLFRTVGGIIGPTVAGFILSKTDFSSLFAIDNLLKSYFHIFYFGFWILVVAAGTSVLLLIKNRTRNMSSDS